MVPVQYEGDFKFLADGKNVVYGVGNIVVLENYAILDGFRESSPCFLEAGEGGFFIAKDAANVEDNDGVFVEVGR